MWSVLIIDDDPYILETLRVGLTHISKNYNCLSTSHPEDVLSILKKNTVDVLVTDLKMPKMDGFELISRVSREYPDLPCIVMTAHLTPELKDAFDGSISFIEKPFKHSHLHELIIKIHESWEHEGQLKGISLSSFLQVIEMEKKTCRLEVFCRVREEAGTLWFVSGELYNADFDKLSPEEAALEILSWPDVSITIKRQNAGLKRKVNKPLMELLMDAMRISDEAKKGEVPTEAAPEADSFDETLDRMEKRGNR
jgi:CheY-like chemotaxis protein